MTAPSAGRVLLVGLPGPRLAPETAEALNRLQPAGVILFGRNLESAEQTLTLLEQLRSLLPYPLLLALDQEGGRVSRLEPWVGATPPAIRWDRAGVEAARLFGRSTARLLRSLGFNVDFAPVVDLCGPDADNGIGDRAFGRDPARVTELAGAFLDGLQTNGVAGCLKHFPGLGDTIADSHLTLPVVRRSREALEHDLLPYRRLAQEAATVMVGHGSYPALDPIERRPASLSPPIVDGLLRGELGYRGLIVTDDMQMGAVSGSDVEGAGAVLALAAGCDLLLYCAELARAEPAAAAIAARVEADLDFARRHHDALDRISATARRWPAAGGIRPAWDVAVKEIQDAVHLA